MATVSMHYEAGDLYFADRADSLGEAKEAHRRGLLCCPECFDPVKPVPRGRTNRARHFAHVTSTDGSDCPLTAPETRWHRTMKAQVAEAVEQVPGWRALREEHVRLAPPRRSYRRADVLARHHGGRQVVFEVQRSNQTAEVARRRTGDYRGTGIDEVVWVHDRGLPSLRSSGLWVVIGEPAGFVTAERAVLDEYQGHFSVSPGRLPITDFVAGVLIGGAGDDGLRWLDTVPAPDEGRVLTAWVRTGDLWAHDRRRQQQADLRARRAMLVAATRRRLTDLGIPTTVDDATGPAPGEGALVRTPRGYRDVLVGPDAGDLAPDARPEPVPLVVALGPGALAPGWVPPEAVVTEPATIAVGHLRLPAPAGAARSAGAEDAAPSSVEGPARARMAARTSGGGLPAAPPLLSPAFAGLAPSPAPVAPRALVAPVPTAPVPTAPVPAVPAPAPAVPAPAPAVPAPAPAVPAPAPAVPATPVGSRSGTDLADPVAEAVSAIARSAIPPPSPTQPVGWLGEVPGRTLRQRLRSDRAGESGPLQALTAVSLTGLTAVAVSLATGPNRLHVVVVAAVAGVATAVEAHPRVRALTARTGCEDPSGAPDQPGPGAAARGPASSEADRFRQAPVWHGPHRRHSLWLPGDLLDALWAHADGTGESSEALTTRLLAEGLRRELS